MAEVANEPLKEYFALKEDEELLSCLQRKKEIYRDYTLEQGRTTLWQKSYHQYFIGEQIVGSLVTSGEQGEVLKLSVNQYRNLLQHIYSLVIQQQITFKCTSTNTDSESFGKTVIAQNILDYYLRKKKVRRVANEAAEYAVTYGEGYVSMNWEPNRGKLVDVGDKGEKAYTGDILYQAHTPNNVIRDPDAYEDESWVIVRTFVNKYDLAAQYEEDAEEIISMSYRRDYEEELNLRDTRPDWTDMVPLYRFYHKRCPITPNGRYVEYLEDGLILADTDLPYKRIPVYKIGTSDQHESIFGYTIGYDIMPMQEVANSLYSTMTTGARSAGLKTIVSDHGSGVRNQDIGQGMRILFKNPGFELGTMDLGGVNSFVLEFAKIIEGLMETVSGVNSEARGRIQREMSGSALALLHQITVTFMSQYEESYRELNEDIAQGTLEMLQQFANTTQIAEIGGIANSYAAVEWSKEDLAGISRVLVDEVNPQSKTYAGRLEFAQSLLQLPNLSITPHDYLMVIESGKVDHMMEDDVANMHSIRQENELMRKGERPEVVITENHIMHIKKHGAEMSKPEVKRSPEARQAFLEHMNAHSQMLMDPNMQRLFNLLGMQGAGTPQPPVPGSGGGNPAMTAQPQQPQPPQPPVNPQSGQRYAPAGAM